VLTLIKAKPDLGKTFGEVVAKLKESGTKVGKAIAQLSKQAKK